MPAKPSIARLVVFGDSLSDSGNMDKRRLFGLLPIPGTGLDKSGDGRFADGLVWPGFFALAWARKIIAHTLKDDYARQVVYNKFVKKECQPRNETDIFNHHLVRNYAEGGASAARYNIDYNIVKDGISDVDELKNLLPTGFPNPEKLYNAIEKDVKAYGARAIVINLAIERHLFLHNEETLLSPLDENEKRQWRSETLITLWAGANDLITVNPQITKEEADSAVKAIINHMLALQREGYTQFCVFNLPDLTKTPLFQKQFDNGTLEETDRNKIQEVIAHFNEQLVKKSKILTRKPKFFDVYANFNEIYDNPKKYGFDQAKQKMSLSGDKHSAWHPRQGIEPAEAKKYMFWNDVHPTSAMQKILCDRFMHLVERNYQLKEDLPNITEVIKQHQPSLLQKAWHYLISGIRWLTNRLIFWPKAAAGAVSSDIRGQSTGYETTSSFDKIAPKLSKKTGNTSSNSINDYTEHMDRQTEQTNNHAKDKGKEPVSDDETSDSSRHYSYR